MQAEIDGRQKTIASLLKEAESSNQPEKKKRVANLATSLDQAWHQRKQYLTQAHELQLFKEQAQQTEDWLASKEAFLNNDDLGENLDAVETLIRKHAEFAKLLESQLGHVDEMQQFAGGLLQRGHGDAPYIECRARLLQDRAHRLKEQCASRGNKLSQARQLQQFLLNLAHEREWIELKMQIANDQSYRSVLEQTIQGL
ncbi:unnamed protein product [Parnassius mnemosyne]|uniref:Spectrin alpha chain-like protein n=1 Tax=Parnassius mnemosyne TaxID=213953 RepID=A0AAV1LQ50_9NEOP